MPREPNPDELGALWEKDGKRGPYMTGQINGVGVVLFRNDRKTPGSKEPDWRVLKSKPRTEDPPTRRQPTLPPSTRRPAPSVDTDPDDDIPW